MKYKSYLAGTKWSGLKEYLFDVCDRYNLTYHILDEDKGLIRLTIYFELDGESEDIQKCLQQMRQDVEIANK